MKKRHAALKRKGRNYRQSASSSHVKINVDAVDRISRLPNEILVSILSRLTVKEAIATSILSTSWRHLYTRIDRLKFHPLTFAPGDGLQKIQNKSSNYLRVINGTLNSYNGIVDLKEFSVDMPCLGGAYFDWWLRIALSSRKIEIIKIWMWDDAMRSYYSPKLNNLITENNARRSFPGLKCLKELSLCGAHIKDLEVELLLSNCPLLESLSIWKSSGLENISVDGRSNELLKLKHLDISHALNLESVEIRDLSSLVSLNWYGQNSRSKLQLSNVPNLTEFHTSALGTILLTMPSHIHDQLRLLKLSDYLTPPLMEPTYKLMNVKKLELKLYKNPDYSARQLFSVIDVCKSLEMLRVQFLWDTEHDNKFKIADLPSISDYCLNLKILVMSEYKGNMQEFEFAYYIVNNCTSLEQLIIEPCNATAMLRQISTARAQSQFGAITSKKQVKL